MRRGLDGEVEPSVFGVSEDLRNDGICVGHSTRQKLMAGREVDSRNDILKAVRGGIICSSTIDRMFCPQKSYVETLTP